MIIIVQSGKIRLVSTVTGIVAIHEFHVWQLVGRLVAFTTSLLITPLAYGRKIPLLLMIRNFRRGFDWKILLHAGNSDLQLRKIVASLHVELAAPPGASFPDTHLQVPWQ